jgi:hypothetical protein
MEPREFLPREFLPRGISAKGTSAKGISVKGFASNEICDKLLLILEITVGTQINSYGLSSYSYSKDCRQHSERVID